MKNKVLFTFTVLALSFSTPLWSTEPTVNNLEADMFLSFPKRYLLADTAHALDASEFKVLEYLRHTLDFEKQNAEKTNVLTWIKSSELIQEILTFDFIQVRPTTPPTDPEKKQEFEMIKDYMLRLSFLGYWPALKKWMSCLKTQRGWIEMSNQEQEALNHDIPYILSQLAEIPLNNQTPLNAQLFKTYLNKKKTFATVRGWYCLKKDASEEAKEADRKAREEYRQPLDLIVYRNSPENKKRSDVLDKVENEKFIQTHLMRFTNLFKVGFGGSIRPRDLLRMYIETLEQQAQ